MSDDQEMSQPFPRRSQAWMPVAILSALPFYALSFGPACWLACWMNSEYGMTVLNTVYAPMGRGFGVCPRPVQQLIGDYVNWGTRPSFVWFEDNQISFGTFAKPGVSGVCY